MQRRLRKEDFIMKKTVSVIAAAILTVLSITACGGSKSGGVTVAVPNDTTNEARALLLLESQGLIKLKEGVGIAATKLDIIENPLELDIKEVEAAQTVLSLQDVDFAVINGNYAIGGGLKVADALAVEDANSSAIKDEYANIIAVKEGNENSEKIKALIDALESDEVREYINTQYKGAVVPLF